MMAPRASFAAEPDSQYKKVGQAFLPVLPISIEMMGQARTPAPLFYSALDRQECLSYLGSLLLPSNA